MRRCARRTKPATSRRNRTAGNYTPRSRKRWTSASSSLGRSVTTWSRRARPSWKRPTSSTSASRTSTDEPGTHRERRVAGLGAVVERVEGGGQQVGVDVESAWAGVQYLPGVAHGNLYRRRSGRERLLDPG